MLGVLTASHRRVLISIEIQELWESLKGMLCQKYIYIMLSKCIFILYCQNMYVMLGVFITICARALAKIEVWQTLSVLQESLK